MIDHVGVRTAHPEASLDFYATVLSALGIEPSFREDPDAEWEDFCVSPVDEAHPVATSGLHVGFVAPSREAVDAFHAAGLRWGAADDGAPGERDYAEGYYGAFLTDPDGNSAEAVLLPGDKTPGFNVDHVWIRVRDHDRSVPFYTLLAAHAGIEVLSGAPGRTTFGNGRHSFSIVTDDRPPTAGLHLALPADEATVRSWHAAAVTGGYEDHGAPGFRDYHEGYYGAFVLDPDGTNVELVDHHR